MTIRQWTREELGELVANGLMSARDSAGSSVEAPDWLCERALGVLPFDSSESLTIVHSDDRAQVPAQFLAALNAPGRAVTIRFRAQYEGIWRHVESTAINLLHDPDVGCIVFVAGELDGDEIADSNQGSEGDQAATNWMLLTLSESGVIAAVEGNVEAMLGYEVDEIVGRLPTDFIPSESLSDVVKLWLELNEHPDVTRVGRHRWIRKNGTDIWIESSYVHRGPDAAEEDRVLVVMWDITERRAAEAALQKMAADFRMLADEVPAAVFRCDHLGTVTFRNSGWDRVFEGEEQVVRLHELLDSDSAVALDDLLSADRHTDGKQRTSVDLTGIDGCTWRLTLRPLAFSGVERSEFIGSLQDITATVRLQREATYDAVTGLLNRAAIEAVLETVLADRDPDAVVLFVDLDRFKAVNDDFGHDAGDDVLVAVANRLAAVVRSGDSVGRWGGDEFVVVFTNAKSDVTALTARVGQAFAEPIDFGRGIWDAGASIGAARCEPGDDADAVVNRADRAMLEVKRTRHGHPHSAR